ncbi:putative DDE Tnp4 domain-containing protein [Phytophthora infestans]|uniref:Putative DDE Tnp4 domain-containing protein n=1 Tax=Phytophthora infestans TaxID=4787 RepID=A0A833SII0_PHYIN|nr:putative DDE Tnp4 domain-containing protein [Phytophthora infestans]
MDSESSSSEEDDVVLAVLLMREANRPSRSRFNFERSQTDPVRREKFQLDKEEIMLLVQLFCLPEPFPTTQRYKVAALEALYIFLRRMAYPVRLGDLEDLFGRDTTAISSISNAVLDFIYDKFNYILEFDHSRLNADTLSAYAEAVHAKGAPLQTCVGFIDGTVQGSCRPTRNQRYMYNGHKVRYFLDVNVQLWNQYSFVVVEKTRTKVSVRDSS